MRFAIGLALVSLALGSAGSGAQATPSSLDVLLAQARQNSGAPYRFHIHSAGNDPAADRPIAIETDEDGLRYVRRRCDHALCSAYYFDGKRSREVNLNDTALPVGPRLDGSRLTLRSVESYAFTDPGFRTGGGRIIETHPEGAAAGFRHLMVIAREGVAMDVAIDERTALLASAASLDGKFVYSFGDQRPIGNGVVVPFAIDFNHKPLERFERRAAVDGSLEPPSGLVPQFGPKVASAKLYGQRAGDSPVTDCAIGGQSAPCLLDTGNSGMAMSLELAEKLGLEATGAPFEVHGIGSYVTGVVKGPPLVVDGVTYPSASYVLLHDIHQFGYDIVLGADAFAHADIVLDYARRELRIGPPLERAAAADAVPLAFENFVPVAAVRMGGLDVRLALDTGDESTINLAGTYYRAHPDLFKPTGKAPVGGIGGNSEELLGEIASVRIGELTVEHQKIGATQNLAATASGHLGTGFLSHFIVDFDYANESVTLTPRPGDASVKR